MRKRGTTPRDILNEIDSIVTELKYCVGDIRTYTFTSIRFKLRDLMDSCVEYGVKDTYYYTQAKLLLETMLRNKNKEDSPRYRANILDRIDVLLVPPKKEEEDEEEKPKKRSSKKNTEPALGIV